MVSCTHYWGTSVQHYLFGPDGAHRRGISNGPLIFGRTPFSASAGPVGFWQFRNRLFGALLFMVNAEWPFCAKHSRSN
jgi:hypothetical protein